MPKRDVPFRMTPLRRRILAALEQRGELDIQEIGYEFSSNPRGLKVTFNHPAAATRFGGMLVAPMMKEGLIERGKQRFSYRNKMQITLKGKTALREPTDAA